MKILITAATKAAAHQLKNRLNTDEVILGDHTDLPAFMRNNIIKLPDPVSDTYTHEMLKICLDQGIEQLYTLTALEANVLLLSDQLFKEYNINIINGSDNL